MSIDGIGKPGSGAPFGPTAVGGAPSAAPGDTFRVGEPSGAERVQGKDALGQLQRGEISQSDYLESRVNEAVEHLHGKLSNEQLDYVKDTLRQQLTTDPVLVELVQRATGNAPVQKT